MMDFVIHLPWTLSGHDAAWVIVDLLTKTGHFIPYCRNFKLNKMVEIYIRDRVMVNVYEYGLKEIYIIMSCFSFRNDLILAF